MFDWAKNIIQTIGYPGIALLMIIENVFPPIPSEIIMPFAGFVSGQGELNYWGVVAAGTLGSVLGTLPFYYIGYKIGQKKLEQWVEKHGYWLMLTSKDIKRAQSWFDKHDAMAVLWGRIVPGIRTLISVPAGMKRMNFGVFILLSTLGTSVWTGILAYLGRLLGQNYDRVEHYLGPVSYVVIGGLVILYVVHVIRRR
ncbi:MAG TPA: DedA family protein [Fodinibius sp.]|nr:DedA family protein [Fodinibius sp.]